FSLDVGPDRFAKLQQTEIGGVTRFAALQRVNGCLANMPRGDEVRLTDAQRNHVRHRLHDVEKFANARARDVAHVASDVVVRLEGRCHVGLKPKGKPAMGKEKKDGLRSSRRQSSAE